MFIGHFAMGLGAKRPAPAVSLGTLFLAAQFLDLLWPTLVLLGVETVRIAPGDTAVTPLEFVSYPFSHSLLAALALSACGDSSDPVIPETGLPRPVEGGDRLGRPLVNTLMTHTRTPPSAAPMTVGKHTRH